MADFFLKLRGKEKQKKRDSVYSVVSSSDVTPGSLSVWIDLPDEIKYDPSLVRFKELYEQHHGKLEPESGEDDKNVYSKKIAHLTPIGETLPLDDQDEDSGTRNGGNRLLEPVHHEEQKEKVSKTTKQLYKALRVVKLTALVGCWMLLTVALLLNQEKEDVVMHTAVTSGEVKEYELHPVNSRIAVLVTLTGPFSDSRGNNTNLLNVWLHRTIGSHDSFGFEQNSTPWKVYLQPEDKLDFSPSDKVSQVISLELDQNVHNFSTYDKDNNSIFYNDSNYNNNNETRVTLRMATSSSMTVPLTLTYQLDPIEEAQGIIYAAALLCSLYILIIFELINRTIAALLSSTLSVAVLALCGSRPSLPELVAWLDVETLLLLLSMMLLVAILAQTGLFDYLAVIAFELTGGRTWPLITCLCLFTAIFSTFLDNVTTVLLMTPVTIRLCEVMQLNPIPVLMSMVIFSNVGGAATPVGDPPNVIIASHPSVLKENINFTTFTLHMGVGILLVGVQTYLQLRYMFRDMSKLRHSVPTHILELKQEIAVWRRAAASLSSYSRDEDVVRIALEKKVERLNAALTKREAGRGSKTDPKFCSTLAQMKEKYRIRDKQLLIKSVISVSFVVIVFFLHAFPQMQSLSLGWTALLGALLLLVLSETEDLEPILARVEWSTLLFFAALFVLMEALSKLGLISWIGNMTESIILKVNEESRLAVAIMLILWVSGIASAFVDNIPLTTMMVRVTATLADPTGLALPLAPLAWALSFGACLGGNGTLIGASANVVCAGVAEQHGYRFTFLEYLKIGFPIMIGNLLVSSVYLLLCHCVFTWH